MLFRVGLLDPIEALLGEDIWTGEMDTTTDVVDLAEDKVCSEATDDTILVNVNRLIVSIFWDKLKLTMNKESKNIW